MKMLQLKHLTKVLRPLTCRAASSSSGGSKSQHDYVYKTDLSYSGVNLGEPVSSMQVEQQYQTLNPDHYSQQLFVNERMERVSLAEVKGGDVIMEKNNDTGIAKVMISNPTKANALSGKMMIDLADTIADLETWDDGKAVILYGDPQAKTFCNGIDKAFFNSPIENISSIISLFMHNILNRLQRLPMINLAAISGKAVGGGAELITACDFRVMEPSAEVRFIHAKMGISPGGGGGARLVKLVGAQNALKVLTSCTSISAEGAKNLGLCDGTIEETEDITDRASDWLKEYTFAPTPVVRAMKSVVTAGCELDLDHALGRERHIFTKLWASSKKSRKFEKFQS